jgi:micrococcal nuclease
MRKPLLILPAILLLGAPALGAMEVRPVYPLCSDIRANSCIEDGNTFWYGGELVRLQNVVPPQQQACVDGTAAKARLFELLNYREIFVYRYGTDSEGHTLARVISSGRDVGNVLVSEQLAATGGSGTWC